MGRIVLKVRICYMENISTQESEETQESLVESRCNPSKGELCKICHSEDYNMENPLLSVCHCTGSMRFVHYKCLKSWLNYKLTIKEQEGLSSYCWKSFECEICKTGYPSNIQHEGFKYSLTELKLPISGNYLVLETSSKNKTFSKTLHVLKPNESKFLYKLGRGHESDIKVPDISVSRSHAKIKSTEKGFILEDNSSKFGTLILLKDEPHEVLDSIGLSVQVGRTMITFSLSQQDGINTKESSNKNLDMNTKEVPNT